MTVRERSRLRPQQLERLGWRYMPLWTIEVFTDPSACADRIGGYLGLEKPAVTSRHRSSGFFDDDVEHLAVNDAQAAAGRSASMQGTAAPGAPASFAAEPATTGSHGGEQQQAAAPGTKEADRMSADGDVQDTSANEAPDEQWAAGTGAPEEAPAGAGVPASAASSAVAAGVLPNKAAEDDPRRWGDRPDSYDHDSWLQEQKPPHWG
jgi:hypothetical protein